MKQMVATIIASIFAMSAPLALAAEAPACQSLLADGSYAPAEQAALATLQASPGEVDTLVCLAQAQSGLGRHAEALQTLDRALASAGTPADRLVVLVMQGNTQRALSLPEEAIAAYQRVLVLAREQKIPRFQMIAHNLIGEVLEAGGKRQQALQHYQQGLEMASNDNERADCYARMAHAHSLLSEHDKAIEFQIKSVLLEERSGDLQHYANANIALAEFCLAGKSYRDAERWLNRFIPVMAANASPYWEARARHLLGKVQAAQGKAAEADQEFAHARQLARQAQDADLLKLIGKDASAF